LIWGDPAPAIAFSGRFVAPARSLLRGSERLGAVGVMLGAVVIDDKGEAWPLGSPGLRERLMCPDPDPNLDIVAYAVHNLGFVVLRRHGRVVRAEMRTALVKPATLIGVYYKLVDSRPQQILLSRLSPGGISHEIFDDLSEFAATVERDIDDENLQRCHSPFALTPRSWKELERARYARFMPIVEMWRARKARLPADLVAVLNAHGLPGRAALLRNPPKTGRLVYEHLGSGYSFLANACAAFMRVGRDVEDLPDRDYGESAAGSYYECLADQTPRLETVSAVMAPGDGKRVWSYYDRLLLPWQSAGGTRFILGLSEIRRRMDLG